MIALRNAQLHLSLDGESLRLSLRMDETGKYEAAFTYSSPLTDKDAPDARWLLEDYPRLRGRSSDPIAARIEKRLHELAADLRQAVFESAEEARPIRDALTDPELLRRLHVVVDEPQTASWTPWELMLAPASNEPLSVLAASFSRFSTSPVQARLTKSDKLRILLITCRPGGEDDVPFRSVASRIVQAVATSPEAAIQVDVLRPPTYDALLDALGAANETEAPYNVVHFDGHGSYDTDAFDENRKRGYLYFEGPDGSAEEVSGSDLGADLAKHGVNYLLLNACRSAYAEPNARGGDDVAKSTEQAFGTLAAEIRAEGVPGVLAMGFNLYVVTAAQLVAGTYAALAVGRNLSEAVTHARRELYYNDELAGAFDWLVPIAFSGEAIAEDDSSDAIPSLIVQASTTTPTSTGLIDPGAHDGPRSAEHLFFGYDEILLRLDRACGASQSVEIVGVAGAGKSAVAGEFARWWVATTPDAAIVLDVPAFPSFDEFDEQFQKRWAEAQEQTTSGACLVVLEGASDILDAESETWSADDHAALHDWIEQQINSNVWLLLTGRTPSGRSDVETIVLNGLDMESRAELAAHIGFDREQARALPGMLLWSQGIPVVVQQIPAIVDSIEENSASRKMLYALRSGKVRPELGIALIKRSGLEFFDFSHLRLTTLPFALGSFQCYLSDHQWQIFCQLAEMKVNGLKLRNEEDPITALKEEFRAGVRAGLVSRTSNGYLLHPLAPIAVEPAFAVCLQARTQRNQELMLQVVYALWASYIQSVQVTLSMAEMVAGAFDGLRVQRENLTHAVDLAIGRPWWGLALPLLHKLRNALLSESREEEWQEILDEVFVRLKETPPREEEMGPENAELHIIRLLAEEAERHGDEERRKYLRELQLQIAYTEDKTIELASAEEEGKEMDIGRIRRIAGLLKRGDAAASENDADCLTFYNEALRLAEESKDILRVGEIHYAIGRAHINVTALQDVAKYEFHAREAIKAARELGPLGLDLKVRASVSLGNAILVEQMNLEQSDPERLAEAREALMLAVDSDNVGSITKGTAHNGLGNLSKLEGDMQTAADEYLAACKEFETAGDMRSLRPAQANAALALASIGRVEDARSLAEEALKPAES